MDKFSGFSVLELTLVLAIIAGLAIMSVPVSRQFLAQHETQAYTTRLLHFLRYARANAISNNVEVIICPISKTQGCGTNWDAGLIAVTEKDHHVLRKLSPVTKGAQLIWRSSLEKNDALRFKPTGFTGQQGHFAYLAAHQKFLIIVNRAGRIRLVISPAHS